MNKEKILVEAVKAAKDGEFGLTGVKVEFEAKFGRERMPKVRQLHNCTNGRGGGTEIHASCGGIGCDDCNRRGWNMCEGCEGSGRITNPDITDWLDMRLIHDKILEKIEPLGLAQRIPENIEADARSDGHRWQPKAPLVWSHVLNDGTVDTEQTLTLSVEGNGNEKNVLFLPKLMEAFYSLKDEIGLPVDVSNAGMHISLLNNEGARYPSTPTGADMTRFRNFKKSMILLMPALYFLASSNEKSRDLGYREPKCESTHKYSAVSYRGGALEFRVFETCYETPEVILDDVMVALNCLKFWTKKYTRNHLDKITSEVRFGKRAGTELSRFYVSNEHIDLLNRGLRIIKPSWYSITELKKQRNFTLTKRDTKNLTQEAQTEAERQYKVYQERIGWQKVMRKNSYIANAIGDRVVYVEGYEKCEKLDMEQIEKEAEEAAEREVIAEPKAPWCKRAADHIADIGEYTLCAV